MDPSVLSTNLRRLRTAGKQSQGQVAEAAGLSRVGYRNIEAGEVMPRVDTLLRIAGALGVKLAELLVPARTMRHVRFRAQKKMTTREELLSVVARDLENYNLLEELLGGKNAKLPFAFHHVREQYAQAAPGPERAKQAAAAARRQARLDHQGGPHELVRDICGLLEDRGVKVLTPKIVASEGFFGLSIATEDGGPAIVVNTWDRISVERWIFTAAHELAHLILHPGAYDVTRTEENEAEEDEANVFASYFLMPPEVWRRELDDTRGLALLDRVLKLKRIFHVSWQTVIFRMTEDQPKEKKQRYWQRFYFDYGRRAGRHLAKTEEPNPLPPRAFYSGAPADRAAEEPRGLESDDFVEDRRRRLVRLAVDRDLISLSKAADTLGLTIEEMRELADSWTE
ncbi:helix-turn-helix domain-containing protein [Sorangium cellulosum]|uniref:helix-turn-helix domain-containing protein n=1 Tax=Sorangium cellulosum TaxID=56 RepID=UPI003D9A68C3